jgi:hypothetical protein
MWHHIPEDINPQIYWHENIKTNFFLFLLESENKATEDSDITLLFELKPASGVNILLIGMHSK